jgi:hypothetical protein
MLTLHKNRLYSTDGRVAMMDARRVARPWRWRVINIR